MAFPSSVSLLNPQYTFEAFVVGENNNLAHATALAVAQTRGISYNPLVFRGGVGLGKTHLLWAIGQQAISGKQAARVAYVTTEEFTNEFSEVIQNRSLGRFRRKYRQLDILLMDDIQFLVGKERIQEEFFHTFNALHDSRKQIVLTCDRPIGELPQMEQRLVSRFEWGLVAELQPPGEETRLAILRQKLSHMNVCLPEEILQFIAHHVRRNIRRLEGALVRVTAFVALTGTPPTVPIVEGLLRDILHEEERDAATIEDIQKRVAERFDLRLGDLTGQGRPGRIVFPRQLAMYLARLITKSSLNTIGEAFGGRNHGTVLYACRSIQDRVEVDPELRQIVRLLEKQLVP